MSHVSFSDCNVTHLQRHFLVSQTYFLCFIVYNNPSALYPTSLEDRQIDYWSMPEGARVVVCFPERLCYNSYKTQDRTIKIGLNIPYFVFVLCAKFH